MEKFGFETHCHINWMYDAQGEYGPAPWRLTADGSAYVRLSAEAREAEYAAFEARRDEIMTRAELAGYRPVGGAAVSYVLSEQRILEAVVVRGPRADQPDIIDYVIYDDLEWEAFTMDVDEGGFNYLIEKPHGL